MRSATPVRSAAVLLSVALAVLASGCGVPGDDEARAIAPERLPRTLTESPTTTTTQPEEPTEIAQFYYVREGALVPTIADVPQNASVNEVLDALASGPVEALAAGGYRSALGGEEVVRNASLRAGVATVDLTPEYTELPAADQVLGLGQIVLTLTARPGVGQVVFTLDGVQIIIPRADGTIVAGPVSRDDYVALLEPRQ